MTPAPGRWLRRALAAASGLLVAVAGAVEPHLPAAADSPAGRALQAQTLGPDPATASSWLSAWRQSFPGDLEGYRALRRGFVDLMLRQGLGEPFAADTTLAALRAAGAALPPLEQDREAQARWAAVLERGASVVRATGFTYNDVTQQVQLLSKVKVSHVPTRH